MNPALAPFLLGLSIGLLVALLVIRESYWRGYSDGEQAGYRSGIAKRKGLKFEPMDD